MNARPFANMVAAVFAALTVGACAADSGEPEATGASAADLEGCVPTTLTGVDVSYHNGVIDWPTVKGTGRVFSFARVSDGLTDIDPQFATNWKGMKAAGFTRGIYQFFRARHTGTSQADVMLQNLTAAGGLKVGDFPPVLDLETKDGQTTANVLTRAKAWLARVESKTGVKPLVYTGNNMSPTIGTTFKDYILWVPHYDVECPHIPTGWTNWAFWQNADDATVDGIDSNKVDTDFFQGNAAALAAITVKHTLAAMSARSVAPPVVNQSSSEGGAVMGDGDSLDGDVAPNDEPEPADAD